MGAGGHIIFLILTILFPPTIILWILCALCGSGNKRKKSLTLQEENNRLLKIIAEQNKRKGYRG